MLSSPVGVVTDLDGTVVFDGVADPLLAPFLRQASERQDVSVIVATSRAPRGVAEVLGDVVAHLDGVACLNGALVCLGEEERRHPMRADHVRAVVDAASRAGVPLYADQGRSFTVLAARGPGTGLGHMRGYPDGRWVTDPAQVPVDDVLKVTLAGRGRECPGAAPRSRPAGPRGAGPGWGGGPVDAAPGRRVGGPEGAGVLQSLLGLRLDGVSVYPHEDGVVDVCAAGVDKSGCMRLLVGEEALAASGEAGATEKAATTRCPAAAAQAAVTGAAATEQAGAAVGWPGATGEPVAPRPLPVSTWVAAGNDANDAAMIRAADVGVVVGDGLEEVSARRQTVRVPSRPGAVVSVLGRLLDL